MTLEQLEAYRANRAELEAVEDELNRRCVTIGVSSATTFPYSKHTVTQEGLPPDPRTRQLLERKARLKAACAAVKKFAESVDDWEIHEIVRLRVISDKRYSWRMIAAKLGYLAEHTPKRKLEGYLKMYNMHNKGN